MFISLGWEARPQAADAAAGGPRVEEVEEGENEDDGGEEEEDEEEENENEESEEEEDEPAPRWMTKESIVELFV